MIKSIISRGAEQQQHPSKGNQVLRQLVAGWDHEQLAAALQSCVEWNTNSRLCHAAHALLHAILLQHPLEVGGAVSSWEVQLLCERHISSLKVAHGQGQAGLQRAYSGPMGMHDGRLVGVKLETQRP